MKEIVLNYLGKDSWNRPVYIDDEDNLYKDLNCGDGPLALSTVYGDFDGEPDTPIEYIKKYQDVKFLLNNTGDEGAQRSNKMNYMMLSRLKSDCDYFLGYGGRSSSQLWAGDVKVQISKMKKLHNSFTLGLKPEWLTWKEILRYEILMKNE